MNLPSRKTTILLAVLLALAVASVGVHIFLSGPPRAAAPDAALQAADDIVKKQGGGEQPRNAEGVPLDAAVDPNNKPGHFGSAPAK